MNIKEEDDASYYPLRRKWRRWKKAKKKKLVFKFSEVFCKMQTIHLSLYQNDTRLF